MQVCQLCSAVFPTRNGQAQEIKPVKPFFYPAGDRLVTFLPTFFFNVKILCKFLCDAADLGCPPGISNIQ